MKVWNEDEETIEFREPTRARLRNTAIGGESISQSSIDFHEPGMWDIVTSSHKTQTFMNGEVVEYGPPFPFRDVTGPMNGSIPLETRSGVALIHVPMFGSYFRVGRTDSWTWIEFKALESSKFWQVVPQTRIYPAVKRSDPS